MNATLTENRIIIQDSYIHKETIKEIPDRRWNAEVKAWSIPCNPDNLLILQMIGCKMTDDLTEMVKEANQKIKARDAPRNPIEPMPIKAKPYAHQIEGYNMVCMTLGIFAGGDAA